jgi:hypothetical protein
MKKSPEQKPIKRHLLISADDKGGVTKSTSTGTVIDAVRQFGYKVASFDGDTINKTLSTIDPTAKLVKASDPEELDILLPSIMEQDCDLAVLDMPGSSGDAIHQYFESRGIEYFNHALGLHLIIALTIVEDNDLAESLIPWLRAFSGKAEFIIFANGRNSKSGHFHPTSIRKGDILMKFAKNRVINIPKFADPLATNFAAKKGIPSDYIIGGRLAKELHLNGIQAWMWQKHLHRVMESIEPHLEWITGGTPPLKPEIIRGSLSSNASLQTMEELEATLD